MATEPFTVRPAEDGDRRALAVLFAAVAEERDGIATEPPVDIETRAETWLVDSTLVAIVDRKIVGELVVLPSPWGFGEIGMAVAVEWRGRGVGTALLAAAIDLARARRMHKLTLSVFAHNQAGLALYRKLGFVEEGRRVRHLRRSSGELWDVIEMGLLLEA